MSPVITLLLWLNGGGMKGGISTTLNRRMTVLYTPGVISILMAGVKLGGSTEMGMKDKNMLYFTMGMERALRIVKEDGVEELEKEVHFRNATGIESRITAKEYSAGLDTVKAVTIDTVTTMALAVLYGEFGFGKQRLERFMETFERATIDLNDGLVTWPDICDNLERLTNVRVHLKETLERMPGLFDRDETG
jgi:hypothetical protein